MLRRHLCRLQDSSACSVAGTSSDTSSAMAGAGATSLPEPPTPLIDAAEAAGDAARAAGGDRASDGCGTAGGFQTSATRVQAHQMGAIFYSWHLTVQRCTAHGGW